MSLRSPWRRLSWSITCLTLSLSLLALARAWSASPPPDSGPPWVDVVDGDTQAGAVFPSIITLPGGFTQEVVVSSLRLPTAFVSLPDGRLFIALKGGEVRVFKNGAVLPTPLIDLSARVNEHQDRGLLGIAVDPDFATNGHLYLAYTYDDDAVDDTGSKTGRVSRFTVVGDTASPQSEVVLLGTRVGNSCYDFPAGSDCIPTDSASHTVGQLKFAPDGTLFVTLGDGARFDTVDDGALRAQDLDSLGGKVLRITRSGQGLPTNPFWNGNAASNRSKVWSYGLRNPYRFNFRPGTSTVYLGDVGLSAYEEIDVATAGANFGWPCYEGPSRQSGYAPKPICQALYNRGESAVKMALYYWDHTVGHAATGGAFYTGTAYPATWQGAYFFGDYNDKWLRALRVDANDNLVPGSVTTFATAAGSVVDIEIGPDTNLYYVDIFAGELRRIRYTAGNSPPVAVASATPREGPVPLKVLFSSAGSSDPDGDALAYTWNFGDGTAISTLANPEHTYMTAGRYTARLTVSDGRGGTHSATVQLSVGNRAPVPTIASPSSTLLFKVGDVVSYSGSASDPEDGPIPDSQLSWTITLHHCSAGTCHVHPFTTSTGASGSLTIDDHGDEVYFDITLTATDSAGLTGTQTVTIHPQTVQFTLQTSPPGLQVVQDGTSGTAPLTRTVIAGSSHDVHAPSPQGLYTFKDWSDGGAQQHKVRVGTTDATYTATFTESTSSCPLGQYRAEYFNNRDLTGTPVLVRCEAAPFAYSWGSSPAPGVNADNFSVRWSGRFSFTAGTFNFIARADDGVRVSVDGTRIIDAWRNQGATTYQANRTMTAGEHVVVMEYYENAIGAVASLRWEAISCPEGQVPLGLYRAEYFNNRTLSGTPVLVRCELAPLDNNWRAGNPAIGVNADNFSVRWSGRFNFAAGTYTFVARADDGVRVYVDGTRIIDAWRDQGATTYQAPLTLPAGEHVVVMEYYENAVDAVASLRW